MIVIQTCKRCTRLWELIPDIENAERDKAACIGDFDDYAVHLASTELQSLYDEHAELLGISCLCVGVKS